MHIYTHTRTVTACIVYSSSTWSWSPALWMKSSIHPSTLSPLLSFPPPLKEHNTILFSSPKEQHGQWQEQHNRHIYNVKEIQRSCCVKVPVQFIQNDLLHPANFSWRTAAKAVSGQDLQYWNPLQHGNRKANKDENKEALPDRRAAWGSIRSNYGPFIVVCMVHLIEYGPSTGVWMVHLL